MRRSTVLLGSVLELAACRASETSVLFDLSLAGNAPAQLAVSVFDPHHALGATRRSAGAFQPGALRVTGLPDQDQPLRFAFLDGDHPIGSAAVATLAQKEVRAAVTLQTAVADDDGDFVPNAIDDCVTVSDPLQEDQLGNGVGDACRDQTNDLAMVLDAGSDGAVPRDLAGPAPCTALLCDDFETDSVSSGQILDSLGAPIWELVRTDPAHATVAIDPNAGAQGSKRSIVININDNPDLSTAVYITGIRLAGGVNKAAILAGPMFVRAYVRYGAPPSVLFGGQSAFGEVFWNLGDPDNVELMVTDNGFDWDPRHFKNAGITGASTTPALNPTWTNWTCVEWQSELIPDNDAGAGMSDYQSKAWVDNNSTPATYAAPGAPSSFSGLQLVIDVQIRPGYPGSYSMWIDQVVIDNKRIGCQ